MQTSEMLLFYVRVAASRMCNAHNMRYAIHIKSRNKRKTAACERDGKTIATLSHVVLLCHLVVWFHFSQSFFWFVSILRLVFRMCNLFSYCWGIFFLFGFRWPCAVAGAAVVVVIVNIFGRMHGTVWHYNVFTVHCSCSCVQVNFIWEFYCDRFIWV